MKHVQYLYCKVTPEDLPIDALNVSTSQPKDTIPVVDKDSESKQTDNLVNSKKSRFTVKTVLKEVNRKLSL